MITEDYVSFETSKLLKEKGFDEETRGYYPIKGDATGRLMFGIEYDHNHSQVQISAPTLQMAMKWLREKNWFICIIPLAFYCGEKACKFVYNIWAYNIWADDNLEIDEFDTPKFNTYEEAAESAIKYCLEKLI